MLFKNDDTKIETIANKKDTNDLGNKIKKFVIISVNGIKQENDIELTTKLPPQWRLLHIYIWYSTHNKERILIKFLFGPQFLNIYFQKDIFKL